MLNELNFSFKIKSQYNVSFFDTSSSNVVHLLVWQYWWWSIFFFFTLFYFFLFFDIFFFKNTKNNSSVLNSIKSNGRWGDLIAGLLPIYWCVNILLNSNMILKVLEWQTETSFCTIRVRGKQWYWVYKMSIKSRTASDSSSFLIGRGNSLKNKNTHLFKLNGFFFKKKFLKKTDLSGSFFFKNKFLYNKIIVSDKSVYGFKNNKLFFYNNKSGGDFFFFF